MMMIKLYSLQYDNGMMIVNSDGDGDIGGNCDVGDDDQCDDDGDDTDDDDEGMEVMLL